MTTLEQVQKVFARSFSAQEAMNFSRARMVAHEAREAAARAAARAEVTRRRVSK